MRLCRHQLVRFLPLYELVKYSVRILFAVIKGSFLCFHLFISDPFQLVGSIQLISITAGSVSQQPYCPSSPLSSCPLSGLSISISLALLPWVLELPWPCSKEGSWGEESPGEGGWGEESFPGGGWDTRSGPWGWGGYCFKDILRFRTLKILQDLKPHHPI